MSNQYACLNTKIMAMRGCTLDDKDYHRMIAAPDVAGVYNILITETAYGEDFYDYDLRKGIHRQEIEWRLKRFQIRQAEKFFYYIKGPEKQLLEMLLMPAEINALSRLIRGIAEHEDLKTVFPSLVWSGRSSKINFERLSESNNWNDFKNVLKHSPYYRLLEVFPDLNNEQTLFQIEKTIERYYYDQLHRMLAQCKDKDDALLVQTLRREIDLTNLVWLYRAKFNYHLFNETMIAFCLNGGWAITPKILTALIESKDLKDFVDIADTAPEYHFLFNHEKTIDLYMERRKSRYLYYAFKKLYQQSNGIGKAAAYIHLTGFEIQDIISIIESKRYGMTKEACEAFLIRDF